MATYSKPTHLPLMAPIVLYLWWRRRFLRGFVVGCVFAATTGGLFLANALITGEFNYQGGDRATFYGRFPFDGSPQDAWDQRALVTTNDCRRGGRARARRVRQSIRDQREVLPVRPALWLCAVLLPGRGGGPRLGVLAVSGACRGAG